MAAKGEGSARLMTFVTQEEAEEIKKKRQAEWERVRKPGDPEEAPAEVYDPRPLYERLKDQRDRAQEQYEEQFKFKNMIYKGLDDEEASFLNTVVNEQTKQMKERLERERAELSAYRDAVSQLQDEQEQQRAASTLVPQQTEEATSPKLVKQQSKSQLSILAGSIITKRKRTSSGDSDLTPQTDNKVKRVKPEDERTSQDVVEIKTTNVTDGTVRTSSTSTGGVGLAGLSVYSSSSSDEEDSNDS